MLTRIILNSAAIVALAATPALAASLPVTSSAVAPRTATLISTTVVLNITTPLTLYYGQVVDGYAQVQTALSADPGLLTGTITFLDGATNLCTIPVSNTITCPATAGTGFAPGIHSLSAAYSGDSTHAAATSTPVAVTILPDTLGATLTTSLSPAPVGQPVTLTATFSSTYSEPGGPVTFFDGATSLGTATLSGSGTATVTLSNLAAGTHTITAVYAATQNFTASSAAVAQVITPAPFNAASTSLLLSSSANPAIAGQSITFTANVVNSETSNSLAAPTGSVTFLDSSATLGAATLNSSGIAAFTTAALASGNHSITASYAGNATSSASLSATLAQAVNAAPLAGAVSFVIAAASGSNAISVTTGEAANILVSVSPTNGFNQAVQLACTRLPEESTCTFAGTTIAAGGGATTLRLFTLSPRACGSSTPYGASNTSPARYIPYAAPVLASVLFLFLPKRRRHFKGLVSIVALFALFTIAGCGACTDLGTRPGAYTLQITGTSMGPAPVTVNQSFQVNVIP